MSSTLQDKDIVAQAQHALSMHQLCDYCLGRLFAKLESGMSNKSRGKKLRAACKQSTKTLVRDCWLCQGLFDELPSFTILITRALEPYEFDTFLIGSKIDEDTIERETSLWGEVGNEHAEPIKVEINRELGKVLETQLHKEVDFEDPTVMVILDTAFDVVTFRLNHYLSTDGTKNTPVLFRKPNGFVRSAGEKDAGDATILEHCTTRVYKSSLLPVF